MSKVTPLLSPASEFNNFLAHGGEMGERIRRFDWANHQLGPIDSWPQSLKVAIRIMLTSRYAMWMAWGPEFYFFCNDAYQPTLGIKKSWALGASARRVWAEIWEDIGPRADSVITTGKATWDESLLLFLERSGFAEETYHTFSYSPLPDDTGAIGGMLCVVTEDTERIVGEGRMATLRELATDLARVNTEADLFQAVAQRMAARAKVIPFGLVYLFEEGGEQARLVCAEGVSRNSPLAPAILQIGDENAWPAREIWSKAGQILVDDLSSCFTEIPPGPWNRSPRQAAVVPIAKQGQEQPAGFLVAAINPYRPFDAAYRGFLDLFAGQIAAALSNARVYEAERKRAEALAEIDRAKTTFFSNVSHEFRTPLTLMLGPVEDLLQKSVQKLDREEQAELQTVHRNGLRLLRLVNSLLDFSRIEAGRFSPAYDELDLATQTADLASVFRSAMEKAGLNFIVDCPPLSQTVVVDRDMWEKIVLNLISNAYKFTLQGEVEVRLREVGNTAQLTVRDTGSGIPEAHLGRVFERFHRVEGARGRTHEGTGIGLALVQELVKMHGGEILVNSAAGQGSVFTVSIPLGKAPANLHKTTAPPRAASSRTAAKSFIEEAVRWSPEATPSEETEPAPEALPGQKSRARIVLADDNADMRDYVQRLLKGHFEVEAVADGEAALKAVRAHPPDLVLTDVMMPGLDGFGLVRELRNNPATKSIPIILLSARAGEESQVEGLGHGADDYLIKPFSAQELLARVQAHLRMARLQRESIATIQTREEELALIYKNTSDVIFYLSVENEGRFRFQSVNPSFLAATGLAKEQVLGKLIEEVIPEPSCAMVRGHYLQAIRERQTIRWQETSAYPSGTRVGLVSVTPVFTESGVCSNLIGTVHDITERHEAEEALRQSQAQISLIIDRAPVGIYVVDDRFCIQHVNPKALPTFGNIPNLIGRDFAEVLGILWPPETVRVLVGRFRHTLDTGESYIESGFTGDRVDREAKEHYDWQIHRVTFPNGQHAVVCYFINISAHVLAQDKLQEQAEKLQLALLAANLGHWSWDPATDSVTMSERGLEIFRLKPGEPITWTQMQKLLHEEDRERARVAVEEAVRSRNDYDTEYRVCHADGRETWVAAKGRVNYDGDGKVLGMLGVVQDITHRKHTEAALSLSEERFRLSTYSEQITLYEQDAGLRYTWLHPVSPRREAALGRTDAELYPSEEGARLTQWKREVMSQGQNQRREIKISLPGGARYYDLLISARRNSQGEIIGVAGAALDVTDQKVAALALQESEERFRTMADATPTMVWLAGVDKHCNYFNKTWLEFTGRTMEQETGHGWTEGIYAEDQPRCLEIYETQFDARRPFKMEYRLRRHDGQHRWLLDHGVPRFSKDGTFQGFIGGCMDIDDQKRAEEKLEDLVSERTSRLTETIEELEAFSYSISHDMRAPLRSMQGFAQILEEECGSQIGPVGCGYLARITGSANRMDRLIQDVLSFSRVARTELHLEAVNLDNLVRGILDSYPGFQPPLAQIQVTGPLPMVLGNEAALTQCISNLLGNGIKFVAPGVVPQIKVWAEVHDQFVCLFFQDNGIGIPADAREKIFGIFQRLSKNYEGTGIGLAIVRKAVERMGGKVGIESSEGGGSTFHIELKRA